jgi:hypothetical protein
LAHDVMLARIFGANWRTSLYGLATLVSGAIAAKPDMVNFLPDSVRGYIVGIAGFIAFVSGGAFVINAKDRQVTGGAVQQTVSGATADAGTQTLVDETVKATIKSGEPVSPEQHQAVLS